MPERVMGVSDDAVIQATGRGWDAWFALLDEAGARRWSHREMVAFTAGQGLAKSWWQQMITSSYERARGLKQVGETDGAGFQIGVQRTVATSREALWSLLFSPAGLAVWLGEVDDLKLKPGEAYLTADGVSGEIRTVREGERVRLTWQPPDSDRSTTLQVTLSCPRNTDSRTTLRFHHERLASAAQRQQMRARWKDVAAKLSRMVGGPGAPPAAHASG